MQINYATELTQTLEFPGLAECKLKHKVSQTDAELTYAGPKIDPAEWHKVLSFFRWTQKEAFSESQVRGFIDPVDNKVVFWAFPQERGTGMTTKEITGEEFDAQRVALPHSAELIYFVTVHHHCNCSAFQSGGDESNEKGQDGLHITIGKMNEPSHDIDVRFYLRRAKLLPDMSMFWPIAPEIRDVLPKTLHNTIALFQMCRKVEMEFPDQWKVNYRVPKKVETTSVSTIYRYDGGMGYSGGVYNNKSLHDRICDSAFELVDDLMRIPRVEMADVQKTLDFLKESEVVDFILKEAMKERYDGVDIGTLIKEMQNSCDEWMESQIEDAAGLADNDMLDRPVNSRKNRKKRKRLLAQQGQIVAGNGNGNGSQPNQPATGAGTGAAGPNKHWEDGQGWMPDSQ